MLLRLRDGAGRWFVWVIIGVIIIALALWGISSYFMGGGGQTPPVAKVNGTKIYQGELQNAYNRLRQSQPKLFTAPDAPAKIKQQLLQNLISEEMLYQAATDDGFAIGDAQLNGFLSQVPAFQQNGHFSQALFNMVLNKMMFTPEEFMQNLQKSLLINQVRNGIVASAFTVPQEAKQFVELFNQKRNIGYMIIPASRFMSDVKVSQEDIKNYYAQHMKDYQTTEKVSIQYLEITPQMVQKHINPTNANLMNYYENNVANYSTPARWHVAHILLSVPANASEKQINALQKKLSDIRAQAEKGVSFASLAKKNSQDIMTANQGGVMPWFTAGNLDSSFENVVSTLKPGEISQPVLTRYGYEIIKLLAVKKQAVKPFASVESEVKNAYISEQLHKIMADKNDTLANNTFENPNTLEPAAKQLGLKIQTTGLFTRKGEKSGLLASQNIVATAFSDDVLQQENNSDVITLPNGTLVVLRVNKHIPASEIPLQKVSAEINKLLQAKQAQQLAAKFGTKLLSQLTSNASAVQIASKNRLQWTQRNNVTRLNKTINPQILMQVFTMPGPSGNSAVSTKGISLNDGSFVIVSVNKVTNPSFASIPLQQRAQLRQQLEATMAASGYGSYVKEAKSKASITTYADNVS